MYEEILQLYPNDTQALVGMGYVLNEQLDFDSVITYYERSLEIDSDHFNAQRGKVYLKDILFMVEIDKFP